MCKLLCITDIGFDPILNSSFASLLFTPQTTHSLAFQNWPLNSLECTAASDTDRHGTNMNSSVMNLVNTHVHTYTIQGWYINIAVKIDDNKHTMCG